jgi:hypothetical protein
MVRDQQSEATHTVSFSDTALQEHGEILKYQLWPGRCRSGQEWYAPFHRSLARVLEFLSGVILDDRPFEHAVTSQSVV